MKINFIKYQACGNDFILIDNKLNPKLKLSNKVINTLSNRRLGIGADGLLILSKISKRRKFFHLDYYNANGKIGSLCGNGSRCAVHYFANTYYTPKELSDKNYKFSAYDGIHTAKYSLSKNKVKIQMSNVTNILKINTCSYFLDTGSPHYVKIVNDIDKINAVKEGQKIRYSNAYKKNGVNVNFLNINEKGEISLRTYERGVEDETLSCGTGIVASSIVASIESNNNNEFQKKKVKAKGGKQIVTFKKERNIFNTIFLEGDAKKIFEGTVKI